MLDKTSTFRADEQVSNSIPNVEGESRQQTLVERFAKKLLGLGPLFMVTVFVPTICAALYFGLFASDVYISEAKFVVRAPDKPSASGLGVLLKTAGFSNAGDEIYVAQDYVLSRDAAHALNANGALIKAYADPRISIFDRFNPIGWDGSFEALYKYYLGMVAIEHDASSSITSLKVRAYSAIDAQRFNAELLARAEGLVNRLNERGQRDLISVAEQEVATAKEKAAQAAIALAQFRNKEGVVDPEKQATVQLQMVSKLQDQLIAVRIQLLQLRTYTPNNPQIPVLEAGEGSLSRQIDEELRKITGGSRSLSSSAVQYQRLMLESQFSEKQLAVSMSSLEEARNEARRKQAYVERIAQPSMPDYPLEPRRFRGGIATLVVGLIAWGILSMLLAGVREHKG